MIGKWIASFGWRNSFRIAMIVSAVATVVIGLLLRSDPESMGVLPAFADKADKEAASHGEKVEEKGLTFKEGVKTPAFWVTCAVWLIIGIVVYSIMTIISVYVQDLGFDAAAAGAALAPMFTVNMILPFVLGFLCDHIPVKYVVAIGCALFTIACIILKSSPSQLGMVYLIAVFTGVGIATGRSTLPMQVRKVFGTKSYAAFIGIFVGIFSLGIAIGSTVIAAFYDNFGSYASAMPLYIPLMIIAIVALLFLSDKIGKKNKEKLQ